MQAHADREDLLNHIVLEVGRDTVTVLDKRQLGELVVQQGGFLTGAAAALAQLCVATVITVPSAAHKITRRAITPPGAATGVSEIITSTATIAATMHAGLPPAVEQGVQISGTKDDAYPGRSPAANQRISSIRVAERGSPDEPARKAST